MDDQDSISRTVIGDGLVFVHGEGVWRHEVIHGEQS